MSTPSMYVDALMKENITWPVKYNDLSRYDTRYDHGEDTPRQFWSGYYSTRPDFKRQIKQASNEYYAESKLHAKMVINSQLSNETIDAVL
jgi:alpha-mannosidase